MKCRLTKIRRLFRSPKVYAPSVVFIIIFIGIGLYLTIFSHADNPALPSGVTLQQIDGGTDYYSSFSSTDAAGWDSPNFYPLGIFNQTLGYNSSSGTYDPSQLAAYKTEGINTFINLYNGYNQSLIDAIGADNMSVLAAPLDKGYEGNTLVGYVWFDEADGNDLCTGILPSFVTNVSCPTGQSRTPTSVISGVNADLIADDPTRFDYCQYTKPVSEDSGLSSSQASAYEDAGCDVVSYDSYIINDGYASNHDLWRQYDDVENVRTQDNDAVPVFPFIEAGEPMTNNQWSGLTATPPMEVAEAWNAILAGARGIQWFDHDFGNNGTGGYNTSSDDLIDSGEASSTYGTALQTDVKNFNTTVESLAPVLNSPFANGYLSITSNPNPDSEDNRSANVMVKYDASNNDFYVFLAPTYNGAETVNFNVAGGYTGTVSDTALVDGGGTTTTSVNNGSFSINFGDQTDVRELVIPNTASGTPAPTVNLSASPTSITSGSSSTLTWSSSNATSCSATSPSNWTSSTSTSGTQSVSPTSTTTYTIACTGTGGTTDATATVTVNPPSNSNCATGDLNQDDVVNIFDLSILLSHWGQTGDTQCQGDINQDGTVNIFDLSILLSHWGDT